jgi:hypothetical protein
MTPLFGAKWYGAELAQFGSEVIGAESWSSFPNSRRSMLGAKNIGAEQPSKPRIS